MTSNRAIHRYFVIIVCGFHGVGAILQTFLQATLRGFGSVAWVVLRPSLLEAATNIEWCLESTYATS